MDGADHSQQRSGLFCHAARSRIDQDGGWQRNDHGGLGCSVAVRNIRLASVRRGVVSLDRTSATWVTTEDETGSLCRVDDLSFFLGEKPGSATVYMELTRRRTGFLFCKHGQRRSSAHVEYFQIMMAQAQADDRTGISGAVEWKFSVSALSVGLAVHWLTATRFDFLRGNAGQHY